MNNKQLIMHKLIINNEQWTINNEEWEMNNEQWPITMNIE